VRGRNQSAGQGIGSSHFERTRHLSHLPQGQAGLRAIGYNILVVGVALGAGGMLWLFGNGVRLPWL